MSTNTYVALDKVTLGSSSSTVTFSSIPSTYTDLVVVANATIAAGPDDIRLRLNGDTGTNYSSTILRGSGSAVISGRSSNDPFAYYMGYFSTTIANSIIHIMNYSNTTTYKTFLNRGDLASNFVNATVGLWRSTAAVNSVSLICNSSTFSAGSTFSLYGIAAASVGAKATGGTIYSDASYYYHVFNASGTFTPTQSITADCLVVAGGGGTPNSEVSGGGGAGGLLLHSSQSLTATGYTVTVGAGGAGVNGSNSQFAALTASVGGGYGGGAQQNGAAGGSGGGGGKGNGVTTTGGAATSGQGYAGGSNFPNDNASGGGGGAGGIGATATSTVSGAGGVGSSTYSSWGLATGIGQNVSGTYYLAGGGGGGMRSGGGTAGAASYGGGGAGSVGGAGTAGLPNTGGGAGGSWSTGVSGGSGVVIVRYAK